MANLTTNFAGLKLRNPFIISSSGITKSLENIRKLDTLGAGAIVLKSLFEEQIKFESGLNLDGSDYPEAFDYVTAYTRENNIGDYLNLIKDAKRAVHIPIIASINCITAGEWSDFAEKIESAGADALELNVFFLPSDKDKPAPEYEKVYFDLLTRIRDKLSIPIIIKLGSHFTNITHIINQLYFRKANGVTLFNRFYEPDIDIQKFKIIPAQIFSSPDDLRLSLRWIGIVSSVVKNMDVAASTGVHTGEAVIKLVLAGAKAVQVCSVLYKSGLEVLPKMIDRFESWMIEHQFKSVEDFRGKLNYTNIPDPGLYERSQFMKYFSSHE